MSALVSFPALGTTATLVVADDRALNTARALLVAEIDAIDSSCSRFRADSELSSLNASAGRALRVSPRFVEALEVALRAARVTDGLVDPTVGRAMRVLGYDRDFADVERDGPPLRVSVGFVPGWHAIEIDPAKSTVRIPAGVELDLGATAKALCADRAARAIGAATGSSALVSLGGDVAIGGPEHEQGWAVLIADDHAAGADSPGQRIVVRSGGVATSGTTVRTWRRGEVTLHHVMDPRTGAPALSRWRTVSVAAASCVDANIASTAAIVRGVDAPRWLAEHALPARLVGMDGSVVTAAGWPAEVAVAC